MLIEGTPGPDTFYGTMEGDDIYGYFGDDTLFGGAQTLVPLPPINSWQTVYDDGGVNRIWGGQGNDRLVAGTKGDFLYGEDGNDTLEGAEQTFMSLRSIVYQSGDDLMDGGVGNDALKGGWGNDTLIGGDGFDTLHGGSGADILHGGLANDILYGDGDATRVAGSDYLFGGDGNDALHGGGERDFLYGGSGDDSLSGDEGADVLWGEDGHDVLIGGPGPDLLFGGGGDDFYLWDGEDQIGEGPAGGVDAVFALASVFALDIELEQLKLYDGWSAAVTAVGNDRANLLVGNEFDNVLSGLGGADTLIGGAGLDLLFGGLGDDNYLWDGIDRIYEATGEGIDTVYATVSKFVLDVGLENLKLGDGFAGAVTATGNENANTIYGNEFGNLLSGLGGNDTLFGGAGGDYFLFEANPGADLILDFFAPQDQFILRGAAYGLTAGVALQAGVNFISSAAPTAVSAMATILHNTTNGGIYLDPDGSGSTFAPILFAGIGASTVSTLDFMII